MGVEEPTDEEFQGLNLKKLKLDQAYVNINQISEFGNNEQYYLYLRSENCYKCPFRPYEEFLPEDEENYDSFPSTITLSTHHSWYLRVRDNNSTRLVSQLDDDQYKICEVGPQHLGEFGVYDFTIDWENKQCNFATALEPVNAYLAILYSVLIIFGIVLLYNLICFGIEKGFLSFIQKPINQVRSYLNPDQEIPKSAQKNSSNADDKNENNNPAQDGSTLKPIDPIPPAPKKFRLNSLDTFRGITIALMIFVNDGAGGYWFFEHATWNGLQLADVVFPWFMWIMGVCIPFSVKSTCKKKTPLMVSLYNITRRSIVLFLLGFIWNTSGWINLGKLRVPGVLQRFGISYFFVASTGMIFKASSIPKPFNDWRKHITDLLAVWQRWIVAAVFVIAHTIIIFFLPVPGCPTGYLGPGGLYDDAAVLSNCTGGATGYIDKQVMTVNHIYSNPTPKEVYLTEPFDPEGILGSMLCIVQVFLGYQAGQIIVSYSSHIERVIRFIIWSLTTTVIGIILCGASKDEGWIPINKNLWSLSYTMVTTGLAFMLFALVYVIVDARRWWSGAPFLYAGLNSIVLYLGHQTAWQMLPFNFELSDGMETHWRRLPESLWGVSCWLVVAYEMHRRKTYITVS